jgi:hypothetical protein
MFSRRQSIQYTSYVDVENKRMGSLTIILYKSIYIIKKVL